MTGFIDIHSHIIPKLDDGAESMDQTISMIKIAQTEGINSIITTPHYRVSRSNDEAYHMRMEEQFSLMKEEIGKLYPQMTFYQGCEIYYSQECIKLLKDKKIPTLAGSKYILVEFSPAVECRYIKNALQEFIMEGYYPIVAHVERYQQVVKDLEFVEELIELGAYIQVNSMSLSGDMGFGYKKIAKKLLKHNLLHFIATDSHSDRSRAPRLKKCADYINKKYGEAYVQELLIHNPSKIIRNEYI